jgi:hypothetical protein
VLWRTRRCRSSRRGLLPSRCRNSSKSWFVPALYLPWLILTIRWRVESTARQRVHLSTIEPSRDPRQCLPSPHAMRARRPQDPHPALINGPTSVHEMVSQPTTRQRTSPSLLPLESELTEREQAIGGPEWEGLNRSYRVSDFLLSFADAFDNAIDRMVDTDPYVLAEDLISLLEWQGGVRTFDMAMRLGSVTIPEVEEGGEGERPLEYVGKALSMSMEARAQGINFSRDLAETSKKLVRPLPLLSLSWFGTDDGVHVGKRTIRSWRVLKRHHVLLDCLSHLSYRSDVLDERSCCS